MALQPQPDPILTKMVNGVFYACKFCGRVFVDPGSLVRHKQIHLENTPAIEQSLASVSESNHLTPAESEMVNENTEDPSIIPLSLLPEDAPSGPSESRSSTPDTIPINRTPKRFEDLLDEISSLDSDLEENQNAHGPMNIEPTELPFPGSSSSEFETTMSNNSLESENVEDSFESPGIKEENQSNNNDDPLDPGTFDWLSSLSTTFLEDTAPPPEVDSSSNKICYIYMDRNTIIESSSGLNQLHCGCILEVVPGHSESTEGQGSIGLQSCRIKIQCSNCKEKSTLPTSVQINQFTIKVEPEDRESEPQSHPSPPSAQGPLLIDQHLPNQPERTQKPRSRSSSKVKRKCNSKGCYYSSRKTRSMISHVKEHIQEVRDYLFYRGGLEQIPPKDLNNKEVEDEPMMMNFVNPIANKVIEADAERDYTCVHCFRIFRSALKRHEHLIHFITKEGKLLCRECHETFESVRSFTFHPCSNSDAEDNY